MSRYGGDRQSDVYRRPRNERDYEEREVDFRESRTDGPGPSRRAETVFKEKERDTETVASGRRGPRQPDFLREDYGRNSNAGQLVVREDVREQDDYVTRVPSRRRSQETMRSRAPPERVEREEVVIRERERDRGPPYPRSERGSFTEKDEVRFRERSRSRPRPPRGGTNEEIDITIRESDRRDRPPPPREYRDDVEEVRFRRTESDRVPPPPRNDVKEEEITFTREERDRRPPPRGEVHEEDITIRERRSSRERDYRGRDSRKEEIDIDIRERSSGPPISRSASRGALVRKDREEWIVRKKRTPSPSPPRDWEKEEIIIRRKERTPSPEPEPPREPTPEPLPPPVEPIYRPPIIQEVITHHRHIDHPYERARDPTPPPPPSPPSPAKEDDLEIQIKRRGVRNGKPYEEDLFIEQETKERGNREETREETREVERDISRARSAGPVARRRDYYEDEVSAEADYYNRKATSRGYAGEAYNGATKDWGLVDIPPGTERVRMDGIGGGYQDISWDRYKGERQGRFYTGDRVYESERDYYNGGRAPLPPPEPRRDETRETRVTETKITDSTSRGKSKDKRWTEITKDLIMKEAIEESGYEYEESDGYFYVMEYLRYEDVLKLVEITEDIRRERRERIREIQWEREESERLPKMLTSGPPPPPRRGHYDERIYEREWTYDRDGGRRYR